MNTIPFVQNIFRRVDQVARVENLSPNDRRDYERDLKFGRDYKNTIHYAEIKAEERGEQRGFLKGEQKGRQEGRQQGLQQGIQQGIQQGSKQREEKLVLDMFAKGFGLDDIADLAHMSIPEVKDILASNGLE